jgi:alkaline phosphatase D
MSIFQHPRIARALVLLALATAPSSAVAGLVVMHGLSDPTGATLWIQADAPATVSVDWRQEGDTAPRRIELAATAATDNVVVARLTELRAGATADYRVRAGADERSGTLRAPPSWTNSADAREITIAVGSCFFLPGPDPSPRDREYGGGFGVFDAIAAAKPDVMLWLGDNLYLQPPDFYDPASMAARYRRQRAFAPLQKLLTATSHLAIWDDHDYGPNDSDASYAFKGETLKLFQRYWPNPGFGLPGAPGTFGVARYGDVHFFLLDDRYYRSPNVAPDGPDKTMFGARQLEWLKQALAAAPRSAIKLVAGGSQLWNRRTRFEGWHHFATERDAFAAWLARERIEGVVFLSGDRHFGELLKIDRAGAYPLFEFTSSPLTSRPPARIDKADLANPDVVPGTLVVKRQFGLVRVSGAGDERRIAFEARDTEGALLWRHNIAASELRFPPAASAADTGLIQLDPFAQATRGMAGCPASSPPMVTPEQMRIVAHERAERGTYCALEGRCEPGGAYRRDPEVNERVSAAIAQDGRFGDTSVAVTTTRRFVTLSGCVRSKGQRRALVALAKGQPGVDRVFDEMRVGLPAARAGAAPH